VDISEILENVDIVDYISKFVELELRNNEYWGLSPFTSEKTPSFSVNREKSVWWDFSSGSGGNVIDFIVRLNKCSVKDAFNILEKYLGIDISNAPVTRLAATSVAKKFQQCNRHKKESVKEILPETYMCRFQDNPEKLQIWRDEGISNESMQKFMVRYDNFSDRIVFPIRNLTGDIINVSGRTLDPNYKEKGLRKYTYFKGLGCLDTIYGLYENFQDIKDKREIILFEGAKSVMKADSWGITNTGAILTSHLNPYQMKILISLDVDIVFALDSDIDIRQDANINKLKPYSRIYWVYNKNDLLEPKESPVDKGEDIFRFLYNEKRRLR